MERVSAVLTAEQQQAVMTKIIEIKEILGFCINLSTDERKALPKMGAQSVDFVDQASSMVSANPKMMPQDFAADEFQKDVNLVRALRPIKLEMDSLYELLDDTFVEVGSEAYVAALEVYRIAKARGNSATLDNLLDTLGRRFSRRIKTATAASTEPKV